ncbi:MAG: P27 family phage terminase small subunit [Micropruina sp.]|jgi:phage terminase small subunit|nr:P27 family phage terminase small subunit [Micropruina sp.]
MSAPDHLPADMRVVWDELAAQYVAGGPDFEAYCGQVARLRSAQHRIADEGLVVADSKGQPVPHPALDIERKAQAEIRAWSGKLRRKPQ